MQEDFLVQRTDSRNSKEASMKLQRQESTKQRKMMLALKAS